MNIPASTISSGKSAVQAIWSDTATIVREVDVNQTTELQTVYEDIPCHLSQSSAPVLNTNNAAAMTEPVFTLEVDTSVELKEGDTSITYNTDEVSRETIYGLSDKDKQVLMQYRRMRR